MRRYNFLSKTSIFEALNKLRAAFLAAKNGDEVDNIIGGVLTNDERLKIGRRIQIAQLLQEGLTYQDIIDELKVGVHTIKLVDDKLFKNPHCFDLINKREEKVEKEYNIKAYVKAGGSKLIFKRKEYTGFKRKNVKR
jgi:uncharacterized protein YerC